MYVVKERSERYETVDTLSDGAMGSVVLARDRLMDRLVAVKTVKLQGVDNPEEGQRLQQALLGEAQVVQLLSHPNIVSVYDVINEPGDPTPSVVMEYVRGSTLQEILKGGKPLPLDFALSIATQIARALEHAHTMGVIHGDIKPSNVLISDDGELAKIADFGIAHLMSKASGHKPRLFGTPRYISPEQILGQQADPRSDLFSLGVVLYEMLTGRSPFAGHTPQEITQEIARGAADLSEQALREVPEPLHPVLRRALARDPAERYQSAQQIEAALEMPDPIAAAPETVATQDLSALVVPEIPDSKSTDKQEDPTPDLESVTKADRPHTSGRFSAVAQKPRSWRRLVLIAALTAVPSLLSALLVLWIATPDAPPDGRFSTEHLLEAQVLPLFKEGRRQMLENQPEVAVRLFRRAQDIAPASSDVGRALRQAEQEAIDQQTHQQQSGEVTALLTASRSALDSGDSQEALRQATQALSMDPENPEAQALIDAAGSMRQPSRTVSSARKPQAVTTATTEKPKSRVPPTRIRNPAPTQTDPVRAEPPPRPRPRTPSTTPGPVSTTADLRVDVFSYLSKGVLTVYADQDQVLLQPFRFVQKSGFMRKKKTAGRLETSVVLPAGPTEFRIYVSADGQETQTVNLEANLAAGQTHVLRLIIAENGSASAQMN